MVKDEIDVIKAFRGKLWMQCQNPKPEALKKQLEIWYRQRASVVFAELLEEVLPKFKRYRINSAELTIWAISKRWGSCTPAGKLILNPELIKAPKGCIEYVITHELCHLVHHNHAKAFKDLQDRMCPDWKKWKERLEHSLI